jgi:mutator protein MutT
MIIRAAAVIIKDNQILLFRRVKNGRGFYAFPGGHVEVGETPEMAVVRELREELTLDITIDRTLFDIENDFPEHGLQREVYFLVTSYTGTPVLSGEEKERMNEMNQYYIEWKPLKEAVHIETLYPKVARERIAELLM